MTMSLLALLAFIVAAIAGAIAHELAHWLVWKLAGREPRLRLRALTVEPRAGPQRTTSADRVAAAAPYVLGACAVVSGLAGVGVVWVVFGLAMVQLPSRVDVATMLGRTEWQLAGA